MFFHELDYIVLDCEERVTARVAVLFGEWDFANERVDS